MVSVIDKIAAEHENIIKVLTEIKTASQREKMEMVVLAGIGAYINNVYNGIENILKQILNSKNIKVERSPSWHKDLIELSCSQGIIDGDTADRIGKYMVFRHFFTHSYGFMIDEKKLKPLIENIESDYLDFKTRIDKFISINK